MGHDHTAVCASASRYVAVEVRVTVSAKSTEARVRMKPGATCWSDLETVGVFRLGERPFPTSPEEAAELACLALREAYPGLF